jgi:hypothetical protein
MKRTLSLNSVVSRKYRAVSGPCHQLIAASALVLAGCTVGEPPAQSAAVSPSPSTAPPGPAGSPTTVPGGPAGRPAHNAERYRRLRAPRRPRWRGRLPQPTRLITQYFATLSPTEVAREPIPLGEWTGSGPGNGPVTTCSTEDDRQVDGVLAG